MSITAKPTGVPNQWIVTQTKQAPGVEVDGEQAAEVSAQTMTVVCAAEDNSEARAIALFEDALSGGGDQVQTLEQIRAQGLAAVGQKHASMIRHLTGDATPEERDTWRLKAEAAAAVVAGSASPVQQGMIAAEADGRGQSAAEFAQLVVQKAEAFATFVGVAGKVRCMAQASISSATTEGTSAADAVICTEHALTDMDQAVAQIIQANS